MDNLLFKNSSISGTNTFAEGNGGNLIINATDSVQLRGTAPAIFPISIIGSQTTGNGNAGDLSINTRKLILEDGAEISTTTFGQGQGGDLYVNASELVDIKGTSSDGQSLSGLFANTQNLGNGGNVRIETENLIVRDGGEISLNTFGQGKAGNLKIIATESVELLRTPADAQFATGLFVQSRGGGDAGNLEIDTKKLIVEDGAFISSGAFKFNPFTETEVTNFSSRAGELNIRATELVVVKGTSGNWRSNINSETEGSGNAGKLTIETEKLIIQDGAFISSSTFGGGSAGEVRINASDSVEVVGIDGQFATGIFSEVGTNSTGQGGNLVIDTGKLIVKNGGNISTSNFGEGQAGNLIVNASESVELIGSRRNNSGNLTSSGLFSFTRGSKDAGDIGIITTDLSLTEGSQVNVNTFGQGDAGEITIVASDTIAVNGVDQDGFPSGIFSVVAEFGEGNSGEIDITTSSLFVTNNAQISTQTNSEGMAGTLQIIADELIEVSGLGSGLFSRTGSTGNAGTIKITTPELKIRDNGQVGVNNFIETDLQIETVTDEFGNPIRDRFGNPITRLVPIFNPREGSGNAGKLDITVASLQLEGGGSIVAQSAGGNGGNIELAVDESIFLRRNSSISTTAGLQGTGGDGGNIDIDAKFIIAPPNENSDITANAFNGSGGNINITAEGVFGLEERSSTPPNRTNDIDASSEFGLDGRVLINTPDVGALQEAIEPPKIVELQTLGLNPCSSSGESDSSSFELTGKGGVPPQLAAPLNSDAIFIEGESISIGKGQSERVQTEPIKPVVTAQGQIYPARGIVFLENGDIILTAYPTDNVQRIPHSSANCRKS